VAQNYVAALTKKTKANRVPSRPPNNNGSYISKKSFTPRKRFNFQSLAPESNTQKQKQTQRRTKKYPEIGDEHSFKSKV
jgi:hypothetical protein